MSEVQTGSPVRNAQYHGFRLIIIRVQTGVGLSGKTTLLKQMRIIYGDGYTLEERREYRMIILDNVRVAFQKAIEEMQKTDFQYERTSTIVRPGLR